MFGWYRRKRRAIAIAASAAVIGAGAIVGTAGAADAALVIDTPWWSKTPYIQLTHTTSPEKVTSPGTVTVTYTARNISPNVMTLATVYTTQPGVGDVSCPQYFVTLKPQQTLTCTATFTITQADIESGRKIDFNAKAAGTANWFVRGWYLGSQTVCDESPGTIQALSQPAITLDKTADKTAVSTPGEKIKYSFVAKNTGNVSLSNVKVTDPLPGLSALNCPQPATLAPGASLNCTAEYTVKQSDIESSTQVIVNTATAVGTPRVGPQVSATDSVSVPVAATNGIDLTKTADRTTVSNVGDVIKYTLVAKNTGSATLTDVKVTDPLPGLSALNCPQPATLAPGASLTCTAQYTVKQSDIDNLTRVIANTATAVGTPRVGPQVSDTASANVSVGFVNAIDLVKTADRQTVTKAGDVIKYTLTTVNTGTASLRDAVLVDQLPGLTPLSCTAPAPAVPGKPTVIAPGAKFVCTTNYTVTKEDVARGYVVNYAEVNAFSLADDESVNDDSFVAVQVVNPAIDLTKVANKSFASSGDTLTYTFTATNTGNVALRNVLITDPLPGLDDFTCNASGPSTLAVGAKLTCTAKYVVTERDEQARQVKNTAVVTGEDANGNKVSDSDTVTVKTGRPS